MTFDVVYAQDKKRNWVFKSTTEEAREKMGNFLGGPWTLAKEMFWVAPENEFEKYLAKLTSFGFKVGPAAAHVKPPPPKVVPKALSDDELKALTSF